MPRISLRAYEKQIEDLIEGNHLQEAITHCRYILTTFPKCISTYRILGKSFLEGKQYSESANVFKRVLAVFPDDFIAHAGMSIVRENESDLDAAIWHMELAFDSQPSNIAIQEELKRLFGRRDGTHPAKIRLTRGALVRMYARGELYPQAIAEIKSALAEDSKRIDLNVLLAKMYFLLGDTSEALALCNQLILELPYCYELNKILVTLAPSGVKSENQSIYLDRLKALNPYEAFVGDSFPTAADVPDDQVLIEQLTDIGPDKTNLNSNWVKAMENGWEESPSLNVMKWLPETPGEENTEKSADFAIPQTNIEVPIIQSQDQPVPLQAEAACKEETQLPDWMRSAGWLPTSDLSTPADASLDDSSSEVKEPEDLPDWLRSLSSTEADPTAQDPFAFKTDEVNSPEPSAVSDDSDELRDEAMPAKKEKSDTENDLPDWLKNYEMEGSAEPDSTDELPDWMKSINEVQPVNGISEKPPFTEIDPLANPFLSVTEESEKVTPLNTPSSPTDWKSALIEESNSQEKVSQENPDIPEWVRSVLQQKPNPQQVVAQSSTPAAAEEESPVEPEEPAEPKQIEEPANPALSEKSGEDLLSWLRDLKPEDELSADSTGEPESPESENPSDFPAFDDGSPLDRLQQVTDLVPGQSTETDSAIEENSNPISDSLADPEPGNNSILPASQPIGIGEPAFKDQLPVESAGNSDTVESKEANIESGQPNPPVHSDSSESLVQDIITELIAITKSNPDDFLAWQRLGDAYAKENNFVEALHAYNQAEELILNNK